MVLLRYPSPLPLPVALLLLDRLLSSYTGSGGRSLGLRLGTAIYSLVVDLSDGLIEGLTLSLGDLDLESGGLAGAVGTLGG